MLEKYDLQKSYSLEEASKIIKDISLTKFDASVDIDVRLGVDPKKADQMVRGAVSLPHGTGKKLTVLALCTPEKEDEAKKSGADYIGLDKFIKKTSWKPKYSFNESLNDLLDHWRHEADKVVHESKHIF